jgi:hypothetical protein
MLHLLLMLGAASNGAGASTGVQVGGYVPATCRSAAASPDLTAKPTSTVCTQTASATLLADTAGSTLVRVTVTPR